MKTSLLLLVGALLIPVSLRATDIVWTNTAGGNWHNSLNWLPHFVPGASDNVFITNSGIYVVTLDANATVNDFTLGGGGGLQTFIGGVGITFTMNGAGIVAANGVYHLNAGTFGGSGTLTVSNSFNWSGGSMAGSGRTIIAPGGALNLINSSGVNLTTRTLENGGTVLWTGTGGLALDPSAIITNRAGSLFEAQNSAALSGGRLDNDGTVRKSTSTGTTTFGIAFNNYAAVEILAGTLSHSIAFTNLGTVTLSANTTNRITGGGFATGSFTAPATALVEWGSSGLYTLGPGALLDGDGLYRVNSTTVTGNADLTVQNLDVVTGTSTLNGTGTITVGNVFNWTGGGLGGSGRMIIAPGATANFSGSLSLNTRTFENVGTVISTGANGLGTASAIITNRPGALFEVRGDPSYSGGTRFDNAGTFRKTTSTGTATMGIPFINYGLVEIQTGTLLNNASLTNAGTVTLAANTTNRMVGGGAVTGTFIAPASTLVDWTGFTYALSPGAQLNGDGLYRINGATLTCNADLAVRNLDMSTTLNGTGNLTISNVMNWTAGNMSGAGRTVIAPGATLKIANLGFMSLDTRTLENAGTTLWTGPGGWSGNLAVITNRPGALFEVRTNATLSSGSFAPRFDNAGTYRKTTSLGTNTINIPFNNYATVEIQTGTFLQNGVFTNNGTVTLSANATNRIGGGGFAAGTFTAPASTLVDWTAGTFILGSGAQLDGDGLFQLNGSTTLALNTDLAVANFNSIGVFPTLNGTGTLTISNVMNWTAGTLSGTGRTIIAPGAALNLANASALTLTTRTLENAGTTLWTGPGDLSANTATITNRPGALFDLRTNSTLNSSGISRFHNAGTFRKSTSLGTNTILIPFINLATMEIQTGTLLHSGIFTNTGTVTLSANTTNRIGGGGFASGTFTAPATTLVDWTAGTFTLGSGAQLDGDGLYRVNNSAIVICDATLAVRNLDLIATLNGTGTLTVSNVMNWTAGTLSGTGRTVIAPGAALTIANSGTILLTTRTLDNAGTCLWSGTGALNVNSAFITNQPGALFEVQNNTAFNFSGGSPRFDNAGMFRKITATGTTTFGSGFPFTNYNVVEMQSGILLASGGYHSSAAARLHSTLGGYPAATGFGQLQVSGTVNLNGALSVSLANGFYPTNLATFAVLTAGTRSGSFANFYYPSNEIALQATNTATAVLVVVTNLRPVITNLIAATDLNTPLTITTNKLVKSAFDPDGDPLTVIAAAATSTNGGTLALAGGLLSYTPVSNYFGADRLDFTISDGHNETIGYVLVTVRAANTAGVNILGIVDNGNGTITVTFAGIPNRYYLTQSTTNLASPVPPNWVTLSTNQADSIGLWSYTDAVLPGERYYRSAGGTTNAP
jgi:hypothetical protein